MTDHKYFTVEGTACTIPKRGALAIYCGDAPRRNEADGTTSYSLRGPLLIIPPEIWGDPEGTAAKVAQVLNENAHIFFDSSSEPAPDWTQTARHMLETWDYWLSGAPGGRDKKAEADRLVSAACFAAQAYCDAMEGIGADGAPGVLLRTFLLALIDPMNPDLDHLRADPAAVAAARAQQEPRT